jgi:hypothetical protein
MRASVAADEAPPVSTLVGVRIDLGAAVERSVRYDGPILDFASQYQGQSTAHVRTDLLPNETAREQARRIHEWCAFFSSGPSDIYDLTFSSRMSKRLFDSLVGQSQLRRLRISHGLHDDLTVLTGMTELVELELPSATSVTTLEPLRALTQLEALELRGAWRVTDHAPIGSLTSLRQLHVGGNERGSVTASLGFLTKLTELRLLLVGLVPVDYDYTPLLEMTWVEEMDVFVIDKVRKMMTPSMLDLEWAIPGLQRRRGDRLEGRTYHWERGERVGHFRTQPDGTIALHRYGLDADNQ